MAAVGQGEIGYPHEIKGEGDARSESKDGNTYQAHADSKLAHIDPGDPGMIMDLWELKDLWDCNSLHITNMLNVISFLERIIRMLKVIFCRAMTRWIVKELQVMENLAGFA